MLQYYLYEKETSSPGKRMSPKPIMSYPPQGSKKRGILKSIGMAAPPLLSPRATFKQRKKKVLDKINFFTAISSDVYVGHS